MSLVCVCADQSSESFFISVCGGGVHMCAVPDDAKTLLDLLTGVIGWRL